MVDARDVADLLAERPDLEPALQAVLEPDSPWDFDDVDTDSGAFGELVSHGIVEEHQDGYRVADPGAVRAALERPDSDEPSPDTDADKLTHRIRLPNIRTVAAAAGGLLLVALFRLTSLTNVFRGDDTVLSANDPYYYRYLVEQSLASGELELAGLPALVARGEPLFAATLQIVSDLAGGTPDATGLVLAWYPVATAALTGVLLLALVTTLTDDRRVALAALLMFALTPSNAFRTSLGFADHHAFDYLWLLLSYFLTGVVTYSIIEMDYVAAVRRRIQFIPILLFLAVVGLSNVEFDVRWPTR
jgi:dolichyl-diphosphooligosaccharide--protein glycosyltransferase